MPSKNRKKVLSGKLLFILGFAASLLYFASLWKGHGNEGDAIKNSKTTRSMGVAALALECFMLIEGKYPADTTWRKAAESIEQSCPIDYSLSAKDAWEEEYAYSADETGYILMSCGSDRKCENGNL